MSRDWVIGIDPGKNETGIVARFRSELKGGWLVTRKDSPEALYLTDCVRSVMELVDMWGSKPDAQMLIAMEDVLAPNPHLGMISADGILGTAKVFGAVMIAFPEVIVVEPGGHGSAPFIAYPPTLRPKSPAAKGRDEMRHLRSAWDIAGAARLI